MSQVPPFSNSGRAGLKRLPIDAHLDQLTQGICGAKFSAIEASPGSGKTTRLPPALARRMDSSQAVWVLEPRRIAARGAAARVAEEWGCALGQEVGYHFRFEKKESPSTRVLFLTEGMLLRRWIENPDLRGVGAVFLDEFHERHWQGDFALGFLLRLQKKSRPDLRIVLLSATLQEPDLGIPPSEIFRAKVEAPFHGVDIEYHPLPSTQRNPRLGDAVARAVSDLEGANPPLTSGRILVFLPGKREIRDARNSLSRYKVLEVHGEQSREDMLRVLAPQAPGESLEILLSTPVAESSITVDGVVAVIDSGQVRRASHSGGVDRLVTERASQASCIQRAFRAGRLSKGRCIRLFSKEDYDSRAPFDRPEVERMDLTEPYLLSFELGLHPVSELRLPSLAPQDKSKEAIATLKQLGAVTEGEVLTPLGRKLTSLPLHPRWGRVAVSAWERGLDPGWVAREIVRLTGGEERLVGWLERQSASFASKMRVAAENRDLLWSASLLEGFPDRLARVGKSGSAALALSEKHVQLPEGFLAVEGDLVLVLDFLEFRDGGNRAQFASEVLAISSEVFYVIESPFLKSESKVRWRPKERNLEIFKGTFFGSIALEGEVSRDLASEDPSVQREAAVLLVREGLGISQASQLAGLKEEIRIALEQEVSVRARAMSVIKDELLLLECEPFEVLIQAASGLISMRELEDLSPEDWEARMASLWPQERQAWRKRAFPREINRPGLKRPLRIQYPIDIRQNPFVESYLQNFYGLKEAPRLADGKIPLSFVLQGPHGRPLQVTQDLVGFFERAYPELRVSLMREYPRHFWPENPLTAEPILHKPRTR